MNSRSQRAIGDALWKKYRIPLVLGTLVLIPPIVFRETATYQSQILLLILCFAIFGVAMNIVFGETDQLFLFVGALCGISAYTSAYLAVTFGVTPWATILVGAGLVAMIGLIVSYVAARRRFTIILIAILTLALQLAAEQIFVGASQYTGGSTGFIGYPEFAFPLIQESLGLHRHVVLWYILVVVFAAVLAFYEFLSHSKFGVAFRVIRQDEIAAESIGVNVVRYKSLAGFFGAAIIGFVGPLYGQAAGAWTIISPGLFSFISVDVVVLILIIVGGLRTLFGPLVGATVILILDHQLHAFGEWRLTALGILLIFLFLYFRQGIVPFIERQLKKRFDLKAKIGARLSS